MDRNEMDAVIGALKRINRCLDERFEKDADLYIAPEQVEDTKKIIYKGNYAKIAKACSPQLKLFSPRAMVNVLVKNAWLMRNTFYEKLRPVFEACEFSYLQSVMNDGVLDNKIDMPSSFRFWLISFYLNESTAQDCRQMLKQNAIFLNHPILKAICVKRALKDEPIDKRYRQFNDYVAANKSILTQSKIVAELFPHAEITDSIRALIFNEHLVQESPASNFWVNRLNADDIAFIMGKYKEYCRQNSSNARVCQDVLGRIYYSLGKKNFQEFATRFAAACACMDGEQKKYLAKSCMSRTQADSDESKILQDALNRYGIGNVEKGTLADVDKIIEILSSNSYRRALGYVALSFDKQYFSDCENTLNTIREEIDEDVFVEFCCALFQSSHWRLNYLLYAIDNLVPPNARKNNPNHPLVRRILNHIENKDLLRQAHPGALLDRVKLFVKDQDFALFGKLTFLK